MLLKISILRLSQIQAWSQNRKVSNMFKRQNPDTMGNVISRLWIFSFFTMVFREIHEMAVADTIEGILLGTYEGNPVTDAGLVAGGVVMILLLATYVLTPILKPKLARRLNLIAPPITIGGVLYLIPNDPDDFVLATATVVAVTTIFVISFFWRTEESHHLPFEVRHAL